MLYYKYKILKIPILYVPFIFPSSSLNIIPQLELNQETQTQITKLKNKGSPIGEPLF